MDELIVLRRLRETAILPAPATKGSIGYDLTTVEAMHIAPQQSPVKAATGWALAEDLPEGIAMKVYPRSSLSVKYNLIVPNSPGLVDTDYTGEILVLLQNIGATNVYVPAGTRIAQLVFEHVARPRIIETSLENPNRVQRGGFGFTG